MELKNISDSSGSLLSLLKRLLKHLSRRRHIQLGALLGLMIVSAFAEIVSLGAILPFLSALISPENVLHQPRLSWIFSFFSISTNQSLILFLTVIFVLAVIASAAIRMLVLWFSTRVSFGAGLDFSLDVYRKTLHQPYHVHLARNSSEVVSAITNKVGANIHVLAQCLTLVSASILIASIVLALIAIDPMMACLAGLSFGLSYVAISWVSHARLKANSLKIATEQTQLFKALNEGLGGIRDVLLDGTQPVYCDVYRRADIAVRKSQAENTFIFGYPRFLMEAIGMILIALLAYVFSGYEGGIAKGLPILGALALGAQRLLPAFQQAYQAFSNIVGSQASIAGLLEMLDQPDLNDVAIGNIVPLRLHDSVKFENVYFKYESGQSWVLDGVSFSIKKGSRVAFVGATGCGKSTTMDLFMGLLDPNEGEIVVDGCNLNLHNSRSWQKSIAHVPQSIFLADASLAENIAFGVALESIDMDRVKKAAQQAQLSEFIETQPDGYRTLVGERGVRLSGGQRQRIGIARALYKQATVLVFDEATSALDSSTEQAVMDAIESLGRELTIVLIAHRLNTVRRCDEIIELDKGKIVGQGSYEELLKSSLSFRNMALGYSG